MKPSIINKLDSLKERYEELEALLGDASVISDQDKFRAYSKEYSQLEDVVKSFSRWNQLNANLEEAQLLLDDPEMKEMAEMEIEESKAELEQVEQHLQILLLPKDPNDEYNCYLEIRAGTGGMKPGFSPAIFSVCIAVMRKPNAGALKCSVKTKASRADLKKLLRL